MRLQTSYSQNYHSMYKFDKVYQGSPEVFIMIVLKVPSWSPGGN